MHRGIIKIVLNGKTKRQGKKTQTERRKHKGKKMEINVSVMGNGKNQKGGKKERSQSGKA